MSDIDAGAAEGPTADHPETHPEQPGSRRRPFLADRAALRAKLEARAAAVEARQAAARRPRTPRRAPAPPVDRGAPGATRDSASVPRSLRATAEWSWRLLIIGVALYVVVQGLAMFQVIVVPLLIALLFVALVRPIAELLLRLPARRGREPRGLAAVITILLSLGVVGGLITLIGQQIADGFPSLRDDAVRGLEELQAWAENGPLHLSNDQISGWIDGATDSIRENSDQLVSGALQATSTAGHVATGFFIVLFASFFFLSGGGDIWGWVVRLFPAGARDTVDQAATRAWATLTSFVRATLVVAIVDGVGVGIVAALIGVPLAVPLGVLVFLGAFVPIVGALVSGAVAVLVALVAQGPVAAGIMLAGVLAVQQLEAHVLQPFLLGRAVRLHPLAVIIAIAAGVLLAGIVGALFAVPVLAVVNVVAVYLSGREGREEAPVPPERPLGDAQRAGPLADDERDSADERALGDPERDRGATPSEVRSGAG